MKPAALVALVALACGPRDLASQASPILSGTPDTDDSSVVALYIYSAAGPQNDHVCSGTVVSPHVVLTAAHCLDASVVGPIDHVEIFLGTDVNDPAQSNDPAMNAQVQATVEDPKFSASAQPPTNDIGLVVAQDALTLAPMAMNRASLGSGDVGAPVHAVGFGESKDGDPTSSGPRRFADTTIFDIDDEHLLLDDVICEGDSGGPTFMTKNGVRAIAGVHSFTSATSCVSQGDDTRIDRYASSIVDPVIRQYDPGFLTGGCSVASTSESGGAWMIALALAALARRKK